MSKEFYLKTGDTDVWLTPKWVTDDLGKFDLDPACPNEQMPWRHARHQIIERQDGLSKEWVGRVWLNPPYNRRLVKLFAQKMVDHGNGIMLVFPRIDTQWFQLLARNCDAMFLLKGRIGFCRMDGSAGGHFLGSVFFAFGNHNAEALKTVKWEGVLFYPAGKKIAKLQT